MSDQSQEAQAPASPIRLLLLAPLLVFLGLAAILGLGLWRGHPSQARVDAVRPLPAFALQPLHPGDPPLTKADLAGQVSMINVFASWCPSCAEEQPMLLQLSASGVAPIYGVAWLDPPEKTSAWLQEHGDPFRRIGEDASGRLGIDLGVTGAPETFIVDRKGRIRYRQIGPITEDTWRNVLQPLIGRLQSQTD
jgi:cytochrome c biogenesis protein CcmG/thiol:disulfide interchange protein DsbE